MCSCPSSYQVSPNTYVGTGSKGTYLTPEDMLLEYSIHIQAKALMLGPPTELWRNSIRRDYIAMLFLLTLSLSKASAKVRIISQLAK